MLWQCPYSYFFTKHSRLIIMKKHFYKFWSARFKISRNSWRNVYLISTYIYCPNAYAQTYPYVCVTQRFELLQKSAVYIFIIITIIVWNRSIIRPHNGVLSVSNILWIYNAVWVVSQHYVISRQAQFWPSNFYIVTKTST